MRWNKVNALLVGAFCAVLYVSAATNLAQHTSDMERMSEKIGAAKDSLDNYHGGLTSALGVARSLTIAQTSARTARENLEHGEPMTPEQGDRYYESYEKMLPVLNGAIDSAKEKAPLFRKAGLGSEARTYVSNLHEEKRRFEKEAKAHVPEDTFRKVQPSADRISEAFDEANHAFQA